MKKRAPTMASARRAAGSTAARRNSTPTRQRTQTASRSRVSAKTPPKGKSAKTTTNHEQIRRWVEARGGHPATVKRTAKGRQQAGILRIDFPGFSGATSLKPITWDQWFELFEERGLAFLYQDKTASGKQSRFNKLVSRG